MIPKNTIKNKILNTKTKKFAIYLNNKVFFSRKEKVGYKNRQFYEDLQDLLELTPKKDVLFIIGG